MATKKTTVAELVAAGKARREQRQAERELRQEMRQALRKETIESDELWGAQLAKLVQLMTLVGLSETIQAALLGLLNACRETYLDIKDEATVIDKLQVLHDAWQSIADLLSTLLEALAA